MRVSPDHLFSESHLSEYVREQRDAMRHEITGLSSAELENSTDSLALIFASKYAPTPIQLHEPVHEDVGQVEKVIERFSTRGRFAGVPKNGKVTKKAQRLKVKIPYSGEKHILQKQPKRITRPLPTYDELNDREIVHYVDYSVDGEDAESIKETIDKDISEWLEKLERSVNQLNSHILEIQETLEKRARRYIDEHRENMSAKDEALAELGISTQTSEEGFVEPEKKKEIELPDLEGSSEETQRIRDRTFVDVLDILDSMRVSVERSKKRLRKLDEESLRDIFLGALDSHYGTATAESFNRGGKTDILLKHDGVNLFIAECKFWRGKAGLKEAIDQLMGNLSSDDSHAALLVFSNRNQGVKIEEKVEEAIKEHPGFQEALSKFQEHDVFRFRTSSRVSVKIAVMVVDLGE